MDAIIFNVEHTGKKVWKNGLFLWGAKYQYEEINDELLEYTLYPHTDVIDAIIFNETIFIIDKKMNQIFSCKILTDQFVKTKSEFEKFNELLKD